ncbi:MAG: electron transfer flavoprotein subunit beta/FixA family protein [Candidatus Omnitrophota bacterium]|nr:electron transfer flavoprotein subunit beta/FixA family protein [Candidatus Omnitrophota bacterium]
MHIVVCIKQVPDSTQVKIDPVTNTLMRQGVPSIINPYDIFAIEEALRIKDKFGAKITAISMGPPQAKDALKKAVSLGIDEAVLLSDRAFAGADTLATSYCLACGIKALNKENPVDLVICGKQTVDGDTAQVGPGIAVRLGFSQLTYIEKIEKIDFERKEIFVYRHAEKGKQYLKSRLPAVITVLDGINELRYAPLPELFRAARYQVKAWDKKLIEIDENLCGMKGSPTAVKRVFAPTPRQRGEMVSFNERNPEETARALTEKLLINKNG